MSSSSSLGSSSSSSNNFINYNNGISDEDAMNIAIMESQSISKKRSDTSSSNISSSSSIPNKKIKLMIEEDPDDGEAISHSIALSLPSTSSSSLSSSLSGSSFSNKSISINSLDNSIITKISSVFIEVSNLPKELIDIIIGYSNKNIFMKIEEIISDKIFYNFEKEYPNECTSYSTVMPKWVDIVRMGIYIPSSKVVQEIINLIKIIIDNSLFDENKIDDIEKLNSATKLITSKLITSKLITPSSPMNDSVFKKIALKMGDQSFATPSSIQCVSIFKAMSVVASIIILFEEDQQQQEAWIKKMNGIIKYAEFAYASRYLSKELDAATCLDKKLAIIRKVCCRVYQIPEKYLTKEYIQNKDF